MTAHYRPAGCPCEDPHEFLRRQERGAFHALRANMMTLADLPYNSREAEALRGVIAKAKLAWWETVRAIDAELSQ